MFSGTGDKETVARYHIPSISFGDDDATHDDGVSVADLLGVLTHRKTDTVQIGRVCTIWQVCEPPFAVHETHAPSCLTIVKTTLTVRAATRYDVRLHLPRERLIADTVGLLLWEDGKMCTRPSTSSPNNIFIFMSKDAATSLVLF